MKHILLLFPLVAYAQVPAFLYPSSVGGSANAQTVSVSYAYVAANYQPSVCYIPPATNTSTTPTLSINGGTAITITKLGGSALAVGDITTSEMACVVFVGTTLHLMNPQTTSGGGGSGCAPVSSPTSNAVMIDAAGCAADSTTSSNALIPGFGNLGFGNTTPDARIKIGSNSTASVDAQIVIARNVDSSTGPVTTGNGHAYSDSSVVTRNGTMAYNSYDARTIFSGSNAFDHYAAFQNGLNYTASGLLSNMYGGIDSPAMNGSGNATYRWGWTANDVSIGGTGRPLNNFGLGCPNDFTAGSSGNWCFYTGAKSNFMKGLLLGDLNTYYVDSTAALQITGVGRDAKIRLYQNGYNKWEWIAPNASSDMWIQDANGVTYLKIQTGGNVTIPVTLTLSGSSFSFNSKTCTIGGDTKITCS